MKETEELLQMKGLKASCDSRLDPGPGKGHWQENWQYVKNFSDYSLGSIKLIS